MKHPLSTLLVAMCVLAPAAGAEPTPSPASPDFQHAKPSRMIDRAHAISDAERALSPLEVIRFDFASSAIDRIDRALVRDAARWLKDHPDHRLVLEAHTDAAGSAAYNAGLAARRARAVRDALVAYGVPRDRVVMAIYGEAQPRARDPYAGSNRVVVLYPTTQSPAAITRTALPPGAAVLWS